MKVNFRYVLEFYFTLGVPLVYLIGLYFVAQSSTLAVPESLRLIALLGSACGIILWIVSYATLSHSFGVLPTRQIRVKRGVYCYFKHPMYLGIVMTYLCLALANQSRSGIIFTMLGLTPLLAVRAYFEDKLLTDQ